MRQVFDSATFAGRNGRLTERQNMLRGNFFSLEQIETKFGVPILGDRVNDHPPTLTKIGQL